jgi:hypothetical protein
VLARTTAIRRGQQELPITDADQDEAARIMTDYAQRGLRVLALMFTCGLFVILLRGASRSDGVCHRLAV